MKLPTIETDEDLMECFQAVVAIFERHGVKFLWLPEDPSWQHWIGLLRLIRDTLNNDQRL